MAHELREMGYWGSYFFSPKPVEFWILSKAWWVREYKKNVKHIGEK